MSRPPFALAKPELGGWRNGNTGTTGVWRFDAAVPGNEVLVTALVHGNELCGAWAALAALEAGLRPRRGALTLALCNLDAFDRYDAADPDASRFVDQDLNRLWGAMAWRTDAAAHSCEQRRAIELRPFVERANRLLDLHSMHECGPPLGLTGPHPQHAALAAAMGMPELLVADAGHREGCRLRDHGRFGDAHEADAQALLVECGFHGDPAGRDVAIDALARFLLATGCIDTNDIPAGWRLPAAPTQRLLQVSAAVTVADGEPPRFAQAWRSGECIAQAGTLLGWNGGEPLRTPYDNCVLVMPSLHHAHPGATILRLAREPRVLRR